MLLRGRNVLVDGLLLRDADVLLEDGLVAAVGPAGTLGGVVSLEAAYVVPGLVDLHVHALDGRSDVPGLSAALVSRGVTSFLATTVTSSQADLLAAVSAPLLGPARCLGFHLEGPWISSACAGAQPAAFMREPSTAELAALVAAGPVRLVTLAPELPGGLELVARAAGLGVRVSLGHSDCSYDTALEAVALGASHVTHCFNAMSGFHHRAPGLVGAAFDSPSLTVEVIADGVHVHPAAVRALVATAGPSRVCLVSDAVDLDLPGTEAARLPDGTLAGARSGLDTSVRNLVAWGVPVADALRMASRTPALAIGEHELGTLAAGSPADVALLDADLRPVATVVGGEVVWQR